MADISEQINDILKAVRGEEVRDAIVTALDRLNHSSGAYTLDGKSPDYFAKASDLERILPLDTIPTLNSQKGVTSGGIFDYVYTKIGGALDIINGEYIENETIESKTERIKRTKDAIRGKLRAKSVDVPNGTPFSQYPELMDQMSGSTDVSVTSVTYTENGEYEADTGKAYNKVTVNVDATKRLNRRSITGADLKDKEKDEYGNDKFGSEKHTFKVETDDGYEDYAKDKKPLGYSEVEIDVSDKLGEKTIDVDPSNTALEANYYASEDGKMGYSKIIISIKESTGPFTVRFMNGEDVLDIHSDVPKNGYADYRGATPVSKESGKVFSGWNPEPKDIIRNTDCYAQFKKATNAVNSNGSITTPWSEIAQNGGAEIPVGAWKILYCAGFEYTGFGSYTAKTGNFALVIQKVYAGEQGTTSTWLARTSLPVNMCFYNDSLTSFNSSADGWYHSDLRTFLNGSFLSSIKGLSDPDKFEESIDLFSAIKNVSKYTYSFDLAGDDGNPYPIANVHSTDKIWIPSAQELGATNYETSGVNYKPNMTSITGLPSGFTVDDRSVLRTTTSGSVSKVKETEVITDNTTTPPKTEKKYSVLSFDDTACRNLNIAAKDLPVLADIRAAGTTGLSVSNKYAYRFIHGNLVGYNSGAAYNNTDDQEQFPIMIGFCT